jgi:hypothetical protein
MPRVQLSLMLAATGMFVFLFSVLLLRVGVTSMTLRYPIAILTGYVVFLLLLRVWIWLQSDEPVGSVDLPDNIIIPNIDLPGGSLPDSFSFGGGGDFAGAGAGGSWSDSDVPSPSPVLFAASGSGGSGGGGGSSSLGSLDFDLDDGAALVIVAVILLLVLGAFVYVIYIAPALLAELVIDGAVVTSLYKPVKNIERHYWLKTALRKTAIPAAIVAALFAAAGFVMQAAEPSARTIGDFLNAVI